MAFTLTRSARLASDKLNLEPQLVLEIDGVETKYGVRIIQKLVRIGDPEIFISNDWKVGGSIAIENQSDLISLDGSSTSIRQQLQPDKGLGSSVSSMQIALVDRNLEASELVSPGVVVEDLLGRRAKIWLGFADVSFPDDFVPIFRGIVDDIQVKAGLVVLNIAHPDQKKRQNLFPKTEATLAASILPGASGLTTVEANAFNDLVSTAPAGQGIITYLKVQDEIIKIHSPFDSYTYIIERGQFGTTPASHEAGETVTAMYQLKGNVIDLALWLMLSSDGKDPYVSLKPTTFEYVDRETYVENGIFFSNVDLVEKYGVTIGDTITYISSTSSNVMTLATGAKVADIIKRYDGTIIVVDAEAKTLIEDREPADQVAFYSQFNVLATGLGMKPDEVDIAEHLRIKRLFLSGFEVEIFVDDDENIKELIEKELYAVAGAYSLPRKSQASVGLHIGPIPGTDTKILNRENIKNGSKLQIRRSINQNFFNTVIFKIDKEVDGDKFAKGIVTRNATSTARIPVGTKARIVESRGLKTSLNGATLAAQSSNRMLNRYKYGAEHIEAVEVLFKTGYNVEIGDIVLLDGTGLNIINTKDGSRDPEPKLYEVVNKAIDLRTGNISFSLVDTNFSTASRYGLIAPSSRVKAGVSQNEFVIEPTFSQSQYGAKEGLRWTRFLQAGSTVAIKVTSPDHTTRFAQTTIDSISGNTVRVATPLGFVPQAGDTMALADYDFGATTQAIKLLYAHMNNSAFADGGAQYVLI